MIIVYSGDSNYFPHIGVSITSLVSYNKPSKIYLLTDAKNSENAKKLLGYIQSLSIDAELLKANLGNYTLKSSQKITLTAYYRLLLPEILPDVDKIIYLDGDTIINDSLDYLWDLDLQDNFAGAVEDFGVSDAYKLYLFGKSFPYFNSGVMIMNLASFRSAGLKPDVMLDFAQKRRHHLLTHDQCVLNYFLQGKWIAFNEKYNLMAYHLLNKEKYASAVNAPVIIHYNSYYGKPWDYYCTHPMKNKYLEVKAKTPWKSLELTKRDRLTYYRRKIPALNLFLIVLRKIINRLKK